MNAKERLLIYLKHLGIGQNAFEKNVGISNGYISNNKGSLGTSTLKKIADSCADLNMEWLAIGEGEMLKYPEVLQVGDQNINVSGSHNSNIGQVRVSGGHNTNVGNIRIGERNDVQDVKTNTDEKGLYNLVPVYNFDAVGGMHSTNDIIDSPAFIEKYVPFIGARQDDICVHVTGNSMAPTHCPGSILLLREVQCWRDYFGYGHCFVLFLKDGRRILKEVQRFDEDPKEYVLCVSHNRDYPPEELPKIMITAVYKVIMALTNEGF